MGWWIVRDIAGLSGSALVSLAAWDVFHPAGLAVAGLFLLGGAWLSGKRAASE